jgi:hypothetical protein
MAEPTEAQRKRSQARERRRSQSATAEKKSDNGVTQDGAEEPLEAVKHAAKVAAAGAAVGAAAAAARALSSRGDDEQRESERTGKDEDAAKAEAESPEAEQSQGSDEPTGDAEEAQEPEPESPEPKPHQTRDTANDQREPVRGASAGEAIETVQQARQQLSALLERPVESVSAFERTHDGWVVNLEVVEVSRVPESTDVLASYEVELDEDRNLRRYARVRRYIRSQADRGDQQ